MGMSYEHSGSASYPRFNLEFGVIAEYIFGGIPYRDVEGWLRYTFPPDIDIYLEEWFNHRYEPRTYLETKVIWDEIKKHPEIQDWSPQIWNELKTDVLYGEGWDIYQ